MRNVDHWRPSKLRQDGRGRWLPNPDYVMPQSLLAGYIMAGAYVAALRTHARGRLLDAGCGDVPHFGLYRDLVTEVVCVDWPGSSHGRRHVDAWLDLSRPLPLAAGQFDTVLLADVLEHLPYPAALLAEVERVLAPDGTLLAMVPFLYWVHEAPHDYFRYTEYALRRLCTDAGLAVHSVQAYGGYPDVLLDLLGRGFVRSQLLGRLLGRALDGLAHMGPYAALRARTSHAFPLGYVLVAKKAT